MEIAASSPSALQIPFVKGSIRFGGLKEMFPTISELYRITIKRLTRSGPCTKPVERWFQNFQIEVDIVIMQRVEIGWDGVAYAYQSVGVGGWKVVVLQYTQSKVGKSKRNCATD